MSNKSIEDRQQEVNRKIDETYDKLVKVEDEQKVVDEELRNLLADRSRFHLLSEISDRLEQLQKQGGAELFWGEEYDYSTAAEHTQRVRDRVINYDSRVAELTKRYNTGEEAVQSLAARANMLNEESATLEEVAEEARLDFVIEREMDELPYRAIIMPWASTREDENRFRKILVIGVLLAVILGILIPMWDIPVPDKIEPVKVPERLAKLIVEKKPPPPPKPVEKKLEDKKPRKKAPEATTKKAKVARKKAETAGLMAFKNNFAGLIDSGPEKKLGAQARISSKGKTAKKASRSLITKQAAGGSGGISTAALSRDVGGAGKGMKGVGFERVESAIGSDFFGEERPLSGGPGPSRTDEEIQIVFDRYKAALYRIYNRELRNNPTLQGKMVLRLTIQPDGSVSACKVESSDMDSPGLEAKIVARVLKFNFGKKEDVPPVTILYPIDFLPST